MCTHIYNGILLGHEKEQNNAIYSNMDGTKDCHTEKDKYHMITFICGIFKKGGRGYKWPYLQNRSRVTHVENKHMVMLPAVTGSGEINWETGTDIYTLLYIK